MFLRLSGPSRPDATLLLGRSGFQVFSTDDESPLGMNIQNVDNVQLERALSDGADHQGGAAMGEAIATQLRATFGSGLAELNCFVDASVAPVLLVDAGEQSLDTDGWQMLATHTAARMLGAGLSAHFDIAVQRAGRSIRMASALPRAISASLRDLKLSGFVGELGIKPCHAAIWPDVVEAMSSDNHGVYGVWSEHVISFLLVQRGGIRLLPSYQPESVDHLRTQLDQDLAAIDADPTQHNVRVADLAHALANRDVARPLSGFDDAVHLASVARRQTFLSLLKSRFTGEGAVNSTVTKPSPSVDALAPFNPVSGAER